MHSLVPSQLHDHRFGSTYPTDAQSTPDDLAQRTDRHRRPICGNRKRQRPVKTQVGEHLILDQPDAQFQGRSSQPLTGQSGHHQSSRIVMRGNQVNRRGPTPHSAHQPVGITNRHGQKGRRGLTESIQRARIRRRLNDNPVPRRDEQPGKQSKRLLAASSHQDLPRLGRQSPCGETVRECHTQSVVAEWMIASVISDLGGQRRTISLGHGTRHSLRRSTSQLDDLAHRFQQVHEQRVRGIRLRVRLQRSRSNPSPTPLPPDNPAFLRQQVVRGHDGRTPNGESRSQGAIRGQRRARLQLALVDQTPDAPGEQQIQRAAASRPAAKPSNQVIRSRHQTNSARLALP